ncbi:hypothetical protein P8452_07489 [Trifolium repens]|nr:hypothetical protein P8452_07489 [Trifolium repens]
MHTPSFVLFLKKINRRKNCVFSLLSETLAAVLLTSTIFIFRSETFLDYTYNHQQTGDVQVLRWNKKPNNLLEFKEGARVVWNQIESVGIPWSIVVLDARHLLLWNRGNGRPLQFTHSIGY